MNSISRGATECLAPSNNLLANIEGAHRVHGWSTPLRATNVTIGRGVRVVMATLSSIGEPHSYVHDAVSLALENAGFWEITDPTEIAHAAGVHLPSSGIHPVFLDVGAQLGFYSLAFAGRGYRVLAIEPMLHNVLAMRASACLNPALGDRIRVVHGAAVPSRALNGSCAVLSPWRQNDHGDGELECVEQRDMPQCVRKHEGRSIVANYTWFHHYRRFCQQIQPLRTLDQILEGVHRVDVAKVDVSQPECGILKGGTNALFRRLRPQLLLINVGEGRTSSLGCVQLLAHSHGYKVHDFNVTRGWPAATTDHSPHTRRAASRASSLRRHVVLSQPKR